MIKKVNYIGSMELEDALPTATRKFMQDNSHNNGWCHPWYVFAPKESKEYDANDNEINNYFLSQGIKPYDTVYIHYNW
jgi:hypothetical protein